MKLNGYLVDALKLRRALIPAETPNTLPLPISGKCSQIGLSYPMAAFGDLLSHSVSLAQLDSALQYLRRASVIASSTLHLALRGEGLFCSHIRTTLSDAETGD
ncbi:hypothetical protein [Siccirubricoccus phaeus]|uniref:hypothetical protein n=1 Tax=Siccirubricoccus phaeus TaxID=2595053 RepID=UPI0011F3650C|nr:hypothetical protein [Siccirubricoccus phaeus]